MFPCCTTIFQQVKIQTSAVMNGSCRSERRHASVHVKDGEITSNRATGTYKNINEIIYKSDPRLYSPFELHFLMTSSLSFSARCFRFCSFFFSSTEISWNVEKKGETEHLNGGTSKTSREITSRSLLLIR